MGIFDPDNVITEFAVKEAIDDGVLVEVFKKNWWLLSNGKPIVATANLVENAGQDALMEMWNEFEHWQRDIMPWLPVGKRLFSAKINHMMVWVIDDRVCFTMMYPEDY